MILHELGFAVSHQDGRPSGMAFVEFESSQDAMRAMVTNLSENIVSMAGMQFLSCLQPDMFRRRIGRSLDLCTEIVL